ncbi:MAG: hypothetical protein JXR84_15255 [Anaerolineae bacterium]|nr:hypothetical protein [Anaerolineae bacterium]
MAGRPRIDRDPDEVWNIKLLLFSPEDDDLIALYRSRVQGTRDGAAIVKAAMRSGIVGDVFDGVAVDDEMFEALDDLSFG